MKTEIVKLSQVKVNAANPRTITERKLNLLVERLLAFPKMIGIRPVVVDEKMAALGGNMRLRAFQRISGLTLDNVAEILAKTKNFQALTKAEQENLLKQWQDWLANPTVEIVKANSLSEAEKKEFIIADNASFGEWDYDKLANEWDNEDLNSWGVDVWQPEKSWNTEAGAQPTPPVGTGTSQAEPLPFDGSGLPDELQGVDINADDLPKIEGNNETAMERIIIVYPKEREPEILALTGLNSIDKVIYHIDELHHE